MPESPRSPRNLYPGWPVSSTLGRDNVAHAMVQILAQRVFGESQRTSITDVAARWGMTASTVSDIVNGVVWPTVETLARLEVGLEKPLWPRLRQNN
ncbi:TPA: helix-turn-helix transcriptional regulator [Corynebacterium striatum]|uniref:helix-turn-helix domain-containing protein n=2 Tax=Corynebacterium striatum TaxID=43770 RepID=UPI001A2ED1AA|nr:helix-turn-helix transcriptional regulator [Corynebacterium striatum]HAT1145406.1 helix-turn-helix transcriptional regulator [Corynebacterium striatum]HAT1169152.1 helix-turn-helix transcriptional regulator [Corynebacterium striatum]HAT1174333.1 helix-turn-helix transcriptional regulator [Corynebacterium striatum]HAT1177042.1 helix-turn-helix transcriptional regulator [Corynebacterium striatum]HAT1199508.1 helix-turn-helix transcriptional regulator [Corynebacterium striatum]